MATSIEEVLVRINGDPGGVTKASAVAKEKLGDVGKSADSAGDKATKSGNKFKLGMAAAGVAVAAGARAMVQFAKSSISAFNTAQGNITKFQTVAGNAHWSQQMQDASTKAFGVISGGAARTAATTAASMGVTGDAYKQLQGPMGDLAVKMGGVSGASQQMGAVSSKVSKAIATGSASALSRYGVVLDANTTKQFKNANQTQRAQILSDAMNKSVGGLNDKLAQTPSGQMQQLSNSVAAVKTNLGGLLEGSVSPDKFVDSLNTMIDSGLKLFTTMAPKVASGLGAVVSTVAQAAPKIITGLLNGLLPMVPQLLNSITTAIPQIGNALVNAIPQLIRAIVAALPQLINGAIQLMLGIVHAIPQILDALIQALPTVITLLVNALIQNLPQIISGMIMLVLDIVAALPKIIMALIQAIPQIVSQLVTTFQQQGPTFIAEIKGVFQSAADDVKALWAPIGAWFGNVWQSIQNVFAPVGAWFGNIFTGAANWVRGAWSGITGFFSGINNGIHNIFAAIGNWFHSIFDAAANGVRIAWSGITGFFTGIWNGIKNSFSAGWNWVNVHAINPLKAAVHDMGSVFDTTANWIGAAWNRIRDAAATPVRWVVNTVYTNGIEKVWNNVAHAVGLKLSLPNAPKFANGGINPGYAPGVDSIPAMTSPGEAWMVPEWTRAVGADNIYRWNKIARTQGPNGVRKAMMGYATGGVVQHFDLGGIVNGIGAAIGNVASTVKTFMSDPGAAISKWIVNPVKSMVAGIGGGDWGNMIGHFPVMVANQLVQKAKDLFNDIGGGAIGNYKAGAGVAQWTPQVLQALSMLGQPASWLNTVLRRMNQESGGNPNAINLWDSNAKMGQPSQGLMQTIPGTFRAYAGPFANRPITDPLANIYAGLNYAIHRYGSLSALNRAGGYRTGGLVGGTGGPDSQLGWLSPGEFVMTPEAARRVGYGTLAMVNAGGSQAQTSQAVGGNTINVQTNGTDPLALAQQLAFMLRRA